MCRWQTTAEPRNLPRRRRCPTEPLVHTRYCLPLTPERHTQICTFVRYRYQNDLMLGQAIQCAGMIGEAVGRTRFRSDGLAMMSTLMVRQRRLYCSEGHVVLDAGELRPLYHDGLRCGSNAATNSYLGRVVTSAYVNRTLSCCCPCVAPVS